MRVILLAATMICASWLPSRAEPSTIHPEARSLVEYAELTPASVANSDLNVEATKIESIGSANTRPIAIDPKGSRVASLTRADIKPAKVKPQRSSIEQLKDANAKLTSLDGDSPGIAGLTGAMRDVQMSAGASPWLLHALNDVGTNPTGWKRLWCAKSLNMWLEQSGKRGCGGNTAISCLNAGRKLSGPQVGAIAVMKHHVGIVKEVHGAHVTLVSGNNSGRSGARKVGVSKYAKGRVMAYVWPE
ncbi:MAG TPA: hypothetical protein VFQ31_05800 [Methyloceanibacter sp.]|nr:hypothetical protein [Methyloceanibacter sp.]